METTPHMKLWPWDLRGLPRGGEGLDTAPTSSEGLAGPPVHSQNQGSMGMEHASTVKSAKMLDTGKDQLYRWILAGWLGIQGDPRDTTRKPRYSGGWLGIRRDPGTRPGSLDTQRDSWVFRGTPGIQSGKLDIQRDSWVFRGTPGKQPGSLDIQKDSWVFRGTPGT